MWVKKCCENTYFSVKNTKNCCLKSSTRQPIKMSNFKPLISNLNFDQSTSE